MSDQVQMDATERGAESFDEESVSGQSAPDSPERPDRGVTRAIRWLGYLGVLLLGGLLGFGAYLLLQSDDTAEASVLVTPLVGNPYSPSSASLANMDTEARLATADQVFTAAASALGRPEDADRLASATRARVVSGSQVINVDFSATSEANAREGAEAVGQAYLDQRTARAEATLDQQSAAVKLAIRDAQKDLNKAVKAVNKAATGSTDRQLAQQALNVASATLAARTDELSALRAVGIDPGQIIALNSESSESPVWPWVVAGLAFGVLVVLGLHAFVRPRAEGN